ncbi:LysR family transcriptional regulator [Nonomuraea africana]|uniref:DNA-binding transcriptional LysR family regulator n=1 Tax=Nonomuraea africana TaxID=46171 RepID=A0ABR9KMW4_9ACTN|nr:LysR family transcriptional regulator [Nonomuraea africana]MBE1562948.1 DNA-binding transcriptional LysR family regulator [Nonomuraea africana]
MDPHLLRTFVTVARRGSFSAAAEELGYTQSAVSQQVATLEADLGLALLRRRPVEPTRAGARLLEHAEPLLLRLRAARADVLRAEAAPSSRLTIAVSPLAVTPDLAVRLAGPPRLDLTIRATSRDEVAAVVASGEADLGLVDGVAAPSDPLRLPDVGPLTTLGVAERDLAVALPEGHPLAGRAGLRLADLVDALWLQTPLCPVERLRDIAGDGFRIGLTYTGDDLHTVLRLVAAGHGLTLLPADSPAPAGVPLVDPRVVHRVELLHGTLTGHAQRLAERLRQ